MSKSLQPKLQTTQLQERIEKLSPEGLTPENAAERRQLFNQVERQFDDITRVREQLAAQHEAARRNLGLEHQFMLKCTTVGHMLVAEMRRRSTLSGDETQLRECDMFEKWFNFFADFSTRNVTETEEESREIAALNADCDKEMERHRRLMHIVDAELATMEGGKTAKL